MRSPLWKLWAPLFLSFPRHHYCFHRIDGPKCERCCKHPEPKSRVARNLSRAAKKPVNAGGSVSSETGARESSQDGAGRRPGTSTAGRAVLCNSGECAPNMWCSVRHGVARGIGRRRLETPAVHPVRSLVNLPFSSPILD